MWLGVRCHKRSSVPLRSARYRTPVTVTTRVYFGYDFARVDANERVYPASLQKKKASVVLGPVLCPARTRYFLASVKANSSRGAYA
jgi:hypothetical protein